MEITNKILDCIREHVGGEVFFDALDGLIRNDDVFGLTILSVATRKPNYIPEDEEFDPLVILSGRFAEAYGDVFEEDYDVIKLEGALRFNDIQNPLKYSREIKGRYCVFIDDSYFAGRTYSKVKELIRNCGGVNVGAFVGYDGSKLFNPEVFSLFRYYEHFGNK